MTHQVPSFLAAAMKLSVWMNGLLVPLNGSVTNLQRFCRPVMFHNDDPVFDLSCSGSSLLFRHARRNLMLCTRHQITNLERNPADIVLIVDDPDGRKSALTPNEISRATLGLPELANLEDLLLVEYASARNGRNLDPQLALRGSTMACSRDPTLQPSLCRFVYFLNRQGVAPQEVSEEHALAYREALALNEISKSPKVAYRAAVNGWNLATRRIAEWPRKTLSLQSRQKIVKLPVEVFASSFLKDLDRLLVRLRRPDPLDPEGPRTPRKPATINQYRRQILRFASELIHAGIPASQIDSVLVVIDPAMAELGLRHMLARHNDETRRGIAETAGLLRNISRILNAPEEAQKRISDLARRVNVRKQVGMTRKNRERLRVLQNEDKLQKLLLLPDRIFGRTSGASEAYTTALAREDALAIAILLVCPIRVKNLSEIHLERNLHRPGDGCVFLVFEDNEVKNQRPLEFELPRDVSRMIDRHLSSRVPELCPPGTPWLFPRRDGRGPID
jgi:hypothetical protein